MSTPMKSNTPTPAKVFAEYMLLIAIDKAEFAGMVAGSQWKDKPFTPKPAARPATKKETAAGPAVAPK